MNKTYRVCFNKARGALMVVNELTKSVQKKGSKTVLSVALISALTGLSGGALADEANSRVYQIGEVYYSSIKSALNAVEENQEIKLLQNVAGESGYTLGKSQKDLESSGAEPFWTKAKKVTINLNNFSYTVSGAGAGSTGTETQAFQLLKESGNVKFENGELIFNSPDIWLGIQNYTNLTLDGVTADASNLGRGSYAISNNCGNSKIINSTIKGGPGGYAFDLYFWPDGGYGEGVSVTVENSVIEGRIDLSTDKTMSNKGKTHTLKIVGGKDSNLVGTSETGGGNKISNKGYTILENVTLYSNRTSLNGAAVYNEGGDIYAGDLTADRVIFSNNTASNGGAIYNAGTAIAKITDSTFSGNVATGKGGAIFVEADSSLSLNGTNVFENNQASSGNDIYNEGTVSINGKTTLGSGLVSNGTLNVSNTSELVLGGENEITGKFVTQLGALVTLQDGAKLKMNADPLGDGNDGVIHNLEMRGSGDVEISSTRIALGRGTNTLDVGSLTIDYQGKGTAVSGYGENTVKARSIKIRSNNDAIQFQGDGLGSLKLTAEEIEIIGNVGGYAVQNASRVSKENIVVSGKDVNLVSLGRSAISQQGVGTTVITADNLTIEGFKDGHNSKEHAVNVSNGTLLLTGTETISISNGKGGSQTNAIGLEGDGKATLKAGDLSIKATSDVGTESSAVGIKAIGRSSISVVGNTELSAGEVIHTRDSASVEINKDQNNNTVINGDVVFETTGNSESNASVFLNLAGQQSGFVGRAYQVSNSGTKSNTLNAGVFVMNVADGAAWNVTGDSFVNTIALRNGGIVHEADGATVRTMNIGTLNVSGASNTFDLPNAEVGFEKIYLEGELTLNTRVNAEVIDITTGGALKLTGDIAKLDQTDITVHDGGSLDVSAVKLGAGTLGKTVISKKGSIVGTAGQFFEQTPGTDGKNTETGNYVSHGLTISGGTMTLGDAKYNLQYASNAAKLVSGGTLVFTGTLVSIEQKVDDTANKITVDEANDDKVDTSNSVFTEATLTATDDTNKNNLVIGSAINNSEADTNVVKDSLGVKDVELTANSTGVAVNSGKILTLVGDGASGNLITGADSTDLTLKVGEKKSDGTTSSGIVQLGVAAEGVTSGGTLNASVSVTTGSVLSVAGGSFAVEENKTVTNEGTMSVNTGASLSVGTLVLADTGRVEVQGNLKVQTLEKKEGSADGGVIQVGNAEAAGSLTIAKSTGGHHIFLDPVWQNGVGIEGASKLIYGDAANVTDFIVVGQNSYAVFGDTSDAAFLEAFANSGKTWGENGTTAAVYVGKPIEVTGGLTVDGSQTSYTAPDTGAVEFAPGSVLFADVGALEAGTDLIHTAGEVTVADDSKVVLLNVESGKTYQLVTGGTDEGWGAGQIEAANAMYGVGTGAGTSSDGVTFILQTAEDVYGNQMQATEIANAAMATVGEAYNYANSVLTNIDLDKAQAAALFDAAMNPMGALGTFTTAYDRSTELKAAVREEAGAASEPRLWVRVTGGRTKLDGISTGAQSLSLKTESFGVIAGGETSVADTTIGAAFSAGTGSTRNNAVAGKDDFSYYGLTAYAQRECAGVTFTADASATWLKSELTVGGAADVDNDADSAVYAIGLEGKKDFEVSGVTLTPFVGLDVYHLRSEGMTTKHGVKVDSANATAVEIPIGARAVMDFTTTDGTVVKPAFSLAVVPTLGDRDIDVTSRFAGAKSNMNFTFADDVQIRSNLGITAEKKNVRFGLDLGYNWGNEERSALSANVRASFLF